MIARHVAPITLQSKLRGSAPDSHRSSTAAAADSTATASLSGVMASPRLLHPLLEVGDELPNRLVGLGMAHHRPEELGRHGHDVGAALEGLADVGDMSDASHDDLARHPAVPEGPADVAHHRRCVVAHVADAPVEQTD